MDELDRHASNAAPMAGRTCSGRGQSFGGASDDRFTGFMTVWPTSYFISRLLQVGGIVFLVLGILTLTDGFLPLRSHGPSPSWLEITIALLLCAVGETLRRLARFRLRRVHAPRTGHDTNAYPPLNCRKPRPFTKRDSVLAMIFFGLLFVTAAAFAFVEERVESHGFDAVAVAITVVFGSVFIAGSLRLGRASRREKTASPSSQHAVSRTGITVVGVITGLILITTGAILLFHSNGQPSVWALDAPVGISRRVPSHSEQFGWFALIIGAVSVVVAFVMFTLHRTRK